jgi:DNA end-binding protein Ku
MAARSIASATVSFGLVSIPIHLYSSSETSQKVRFNFLAPDGSRVKQQYVHANSGDVIPRADLRRGYEFAKDQYVTFTPEELKALEAEASRAIEIAEFVPLEAVDRSYISKVYYLGPDKGGEKAYRLLGEAMKATGWAALAKYAARGKQYLVLVRPIGDHLVMEQLNHANEVRAIDEVPVGDADVDETELKLAVQLIEQIATDTFDPAKYGDEVGQRMLEAIEKKIADGSEITAPPEGEPQAQVIDLMEALKASVSKGGSSSGRKGARRRKSGGRMKKAVGDG